MIERSIFACQVDDPGLEAPAATRERLKDAFPRGATRRMSQLGLLIGGVLQPLGVGPADTLVYATTFAENQALEEYLASFPTPSPTQFQTSIHPSAAQQVLIARQQPLRELFPLAGKTHLAAQALTAALLTPAERVLVCGGEERGNWLREHGSASEETFAFALGLSAGAAGAIGRVTLERTGAAEAPVSLRAFFDHLRDRKALRLAPGGGLELEVTWR